MRTDRSPCTLIFLFPHRRGIGVTGSSFAELELLDAGRVSAGRIYLPTVDTVGEVVPIVH